MNNERGKRTLILTVLAIFVIVSGALGYGVSLLGPSKPIYRGLGKQSLTLISVAPKEIWHSVQTNVC